MVRIEHNFSGRQLHFGSDRGDARKLIGIEAGQQVDTLERNHLFHEIEFRHIPLAQASAAFSSFISTAAAAAHATIHESEDPRSSRIAVSAVFGSIRNSSRACCSIWSEVSSSGIRRCRVSRSRALSRYSCAADWRSALPDSIARYAL